MSYCTTRKAYEILTITRQVYLDIRWIRMVLIGRKRFALVSGIFFQWGQDLNTVLSVDQRIDKRGQVIWFLEC